MKLVKKSLSQHVEQALRRKIILLQLTEGDHLKESQLAEEFHISRGPVREAMKQLAFEGLVTTSASGRSVVSRFDPQFVEQIYAFRILLETFAISQISQQMVDKLGAPLAERLQLMRDNLGNNSVYLEHDFQLHYLIVQMSNNQALINSWLALKELFNALIEVTTEASQARNLEIYEEHARFVNDILAFQLHGASEHLSKHLRHAMIFYRNAVFHNDREEE